MAVKITNNLMTLGDEKTEKPNVTHRLQVPEESQHVSGALVQPKDNNILMNKTNLKRLGQENDNKKGLLDDQALEKIEPTSDI